MPGGSQRQETACNVTFRHTNVAYTLVTQMLQVHRWVCCHARPGTQCPAWTAKPEGLLQRLLSHHVGLWRPCHGSVSGVGVQPTKLL